MATPQGSTEPDPLSQGLEKYAIAQEKVGEARLDQDEKIQGRFLAGWSTTLNQSLKSADKARSAVNTARLNLDAVKSRASAGGKHEESYTEPQRRAIEQAEDAFVEKVDEATSVMRNVLDTPEPLRQLAELIAAQQEFHKQAAEILSEVAPDIEQLQTDQEVFIPAPASAVGDASASEVTAAILPMRCGSCLGEIGGGSATDGSPSKATCLLPRRDVVALLLLLGSKRSSIGADPNGLSKAGIEFLLASCSSLSTTEGRWTGTTGASSCVGGIDSVGTVIAS